MSFPVIPDHMLAELNKQQAKKKASEMVTSVVAKSKEKTHNLTDSLVLLTMSFWYFFFTGLAIILKRDIPKEWFKLGKDINRGRIARKIRNLPLESSSESSEARKPRKFKVMDISPTQPLREIKLRPSTVSKVGKTSSAGK